jgi:hypothetical protein
MVPATDNGIVNKPSNHSVEETVEKLKGILQAKGLYPACGPQLRTDHSGRRRLPHHAASREAAN